MTTPETPSTHTPDDELSDEVHNALDSISLAAGLCYEIMREARMDDGDIIQHMTSAVLRDIP